MKVHVATIRAWDNNRTVAGVFYTQAEALAALEKVAGTKLELVNTNYALDYRGIEVGECVEMTIGEQLPWHVAAGS